MIAARNNFIYGILCGLGIALLIASLTGRLTMDCKSDERVSQLDICNPESFGNVDYDCLIEVE